jgi:hypothetical protein
MKLTDYIKAGAKVAPAFLIILYFGFVGLDLLSTFIGNPDLKYEGGYLVRYFNLNWSQFIIIYLLVAVIVTVWLLVALGFLHIFYSKNKPNQNQGLIKEALKNKKALLSILIIGVFYSHIINIGFIVINNILAIIYFQGKSSFLYNVSFLYIQKQRIFFLLIQTFPIVLGYIIAYYKTLKIKNYYNNL